jgi:hypothetical protein
VAVACGDQAAVTSSPGGLQTASGTASGAGAATGAGATHNVGGSFNATGGAPGNSGGASAAGGLDSDAACVSTGADGQPVQVDLYFMVDITGSMKCPVPEDATQPACEVDPGAPYSPVNRWTTEKAALLAFADAPANAGLGVGIRFFPDTNDICNATVYQTPAVAIAPLPNAMLDMVINNQNPGGSTPTVPSIQGALAYAKAYATMNPSHRVAVVYSTDGYPQGCDATNTIPNAVTAAGNALGGMPSIPTYVLGLGRNVSDLNSIAVAGGTTQAYLIDTTQDAASQLSAALASIRTKTAVGCQYIIPPPPNGQTLDLGKVNVQFTDSAGMVTPLSQDATAGCTDGWQYSADNKQINLCSNTCSTVTADSGAKVTVEFGCATSTGPK